MKRVLLVEDSPTQAARLRNFLAKDDLEVVPVASAEQALKSLESELPDVIVLDNRLPGMTGNEFCREIRLNINTRAIPVLMLTADTSDAAQKQSLASGADDYVSKNVDPDILRVRIQALLRKSETAVAMPEVENRFAQTRVLAIDDSPTFLRCIEQELQTEHYHVETASSPEEGLRRLQHASFDCVLVDFEMDGLDGAEVCRRIRESHSDPEPQIVLIVFSSHEDKQRMSKGFEAGADDYISKSSDFSVTKARIRALLRRKFLVEENRRISEDIRQKELDTLRERAERQAAEMRAELADQLAEANQKLDRANRELEHFAYSAAHDLQEPLRRVRTFSELLKRRYTGKLDGEAMEFIDQCVEGAAQMSQLISDLLTYARTSASEAKELASLDLNLVLDKVLRNLQTAIHDSGATVEHGLLPSVMAEEIRIQQLLQNLVGNALKYSRPQIPPHVTISAQQREDDWLFAICDNGTGIEADYLERVFEPFKRFHSGPRTGTGFGLAICKRIVEAFGGRIWAESEVGTGSTFYFTVPSSRCRAPEPLQPARS